MDAVEVSRTIHLLAIAFFVGGQFLIASAVPVLKGTEQMTAVARRFGVGSMIAIGLAIVTGAMMASENERWSDPLLHTKLFVLVIVLGVTALHVRNGAKPWMHPVIALGSVAVLVLGVALAHNW